MNLLDLPAEIIRAILYELEPEAFYICLLTNKLFRYHAHDSTDLLLKQISRIPGIGPQKSDGLAAAELMEMFVTRATQHLRHGAWMANVHSWRSDKKMSKERTKMLKFSLEYDANRKDNSQLVQLVYIHMQDDASVHVYFIEKSGDTDQDYHPRLKHIITPYSVHRRYPCNKGLDNTIEVLKVAPHPGLGHSSRLHIAVLYRVTPRPNDGVPSSWRKITIFALDDNFGPLVVETLDPGPLLVMPRPPPAVPEEVVAMSVSESGVIVIVSRQHYNYGHDYQVNFYWKWEDEDTQESYTGEHTVPTFNRLPPSDILRREQISDVSTRGGYILFYRADIPMPQWTIPGILGFPQGDVIQGLGQFTRRLTHLTNTAFTLTRPSLGRAIACHHHCKISDSELNDGDETCVNTVLQLAIARNEHTDYDPYAFRNGAFLIKAFHCPSDCSRFNLEADYPDLEHVYVAQLVGLPDLNNLSTLGLKVAISPEAHRIAIASWKTVKVWSIDPRAFLDPDYGIKGGPSAGDYAYAECCGHDFYDCEELEDIPVLLKPVELPNSRVVYGMEFRDEDELWGWCEDGIVKWSFDTHANMERTIDVL